MNISYNAVTEKGVTNLCAKMGRPTTNPKTTEIKIRATEEDKEKLLFCCSQTGKTQYQVVMEGIELQYKSLKK